MMRNLMVPLSGTRVYSIYRVVDVDVAPCGHGRAAATARWSCTWEDVRCDNFFPLYLEGVDEERNG